MSIDSDHVNYLVYRYLQESGFQHSSFTFAQESGVARSSVANAKIPPGSLIGHLQRALNYVQAEVNLTEDGRPADLEDLETIEALNLIESVQPEVCEERRQQLRARLRENAKGGSAAGSGDGAQGDDSKAKGEGQAGDGKGSAMDKTLEVPADRVKVLKGHEDEVFTCTWNPKHNILATGSSDSSARIWNLDSGDGSIVLRHMPPQNSDSNHVTTVQWSPDGNTLATGSYDGTARLWSKQGDLQNRLQGHAGPIFALKWNFKGDLLVTSSVDGTAIVWLPSSGQIRQRFAYHTSACLDVCWRTDTCFASCSTDQVVYVCQLGESKPARSFVGHSDEVNAIQWDDTGSYLASCSDDCTAKIWTMEMDGELHSLSHQDKVYSLAWSSAKGSANLPLMLATASFDNTSRIWDAKKGSCIYTLTGHSLPVYSVAFSPNSRFLATGSSDNCLLVWSTQTGDLVQSHHGGGGIFEVAWNEDGNKIAVCFSDYTAAVISFKS